MGGGGSTGPLSRKPLIFTVLPVVVTFCPVNAARKASTVSRRRVKNGHDRGAEPHLLARDSGGPERHERVTVEGLVRPRISEACALRMLHHFAEVRVLKTVKRYCNSKSHHGGEILLMVVKDINPLWRVRASAKSIPAPAKR